MIDVLVPTCGRPAALAVTLTSLANQVGAPPMRVIVADQTPDAVDDPLVVGVLRVLRDRGMDVQVYRRPERLGVAEQREFLLSAATAPYVLFLDDDVLLDPGVVARLHDAIERLGCGFVGAPLVGLSYRDDVRRHQWTAFEPVAGLRRGAVPPERVRAGGGAWERWQLHNAANPLHLAEVAGASADAPVAYKVAWISGCVLYDRAALVASGGYDFWPKLPPDACGEDVVACLRVQERFGGVGLLPSGAVHLELPTTLPHRPVSAYDVVFADESAATAAS